MKGQSWFKFNSLGLALHKALKFYTSVVEGLKIKVRKFWGEGQLFGLQKIREKSGSGVFLFPPPNLNRVKVSIKYQFLRFFIETFVKLRCPQLLSNIGKIFTCVYINYNYCDSELTRNSELKPFSLNSRKLKGATKL